MLTTTVKQLRVVVCEHDAEKGAKRNGCYKKCHRSCKGSLSISQ